MVSPDNKMHNKKQRLTDVVFVILWGGAAAKCKSFDLVWLNPNCLAGLKPTDKLAVKG